LHAIIAHETIALVSFFRGRIFELMTPEFDHFFDLKNSPAYSETAVVKIVKRNW